jgi:hypothetical protein
MKISLAAVELTNWTTLRARSVSVNGQTVVELVDIVRSLYKKAFWRGNDAITLQFEVAWYFNTHVEAQVFLLTHFSVVPKFGLCTIECGEPGETSQNVYLPNAVLSASPQGIFNGLQVVVQYVIQAGQATTDIPPNFYQGDEAMILRGKEDLDSGVATAAVVFDESFPPGTEVIVTPTIAKPSGSGSNIFATLRDDLVTVDGFTVELSGDTPDADHKLVWIAIGT